MNKFIYIWNIFMLPSFAFFAAYQFFVKHNQTHLLIDISLVVLGIIILINDKFNSQQ